MVEFKNILLDKSAVPGAMEHKFICWPGTHYTLVSPLNSFVGFNLRLEKAIHLLESAPRLNYAIGVPFFTCSSGLKRTTSPSSGIPPITSTSDLKPAIRLGGKFTTATT
jgi:hypothetical protein